MENKSEVEAFISNLRDRLIDGLSIPREYLEPQEPIDKELPWEDNNEK